MGKAMKTNNGSGTCESRLQGDHSDVDVEEFLQGIETGDGQALAKFSALPPEIRSRIMERWGDLGRQTQVSLVRSVAGKNEVVVEGIQTKISNLREELAGPDASALERLMIERILCCWLQAHHADLVAAQSENMPPGPADYHQRRQDRATKRFLQACKALAQVRRLLGPSVQVNVAEKQINVLAADRAE